MGDNGTIKKRLKEFIGNQRISVREFERRCGLGWASLAASIDVPIEVISQALGHSYGLAVTLGYIVPDRRKVDEANRKVLDLLCCKADACKT